MNICDTLRAMYDADAAANAAAGETAAAVPEVAGAPLVEAQVSGTDALDRLPLGMDYVPMQRWGATYDGLQALDAGTIFPDLNLPFEGRRLSR